MLIDMTQPAIVLWGQSESKHQGVRLTHQSRQSAVPSICFAAKILRHSCVGSVERTQQFGGILRCVERTRDFFCTLLGRTVIWPLKAVHYQHCLTSDRLRHIVGRVLLSRGFPESFQRPGCRIPSSHFYRSFHTRVLKWATAADLSRMVGQRNVHE